MSIKYTRPTTKLFTVTEGEDVTTWQADTMTTVGKRLLRLFLEDRDYSYGHKGRAQFVTDALASHPELGYDTITKVLAASIAKLYHITKTENKLPLSNRDINQMEYILHKNLYVSLETQGYV
jgi:hypothetical protein